MIVNIFFTFILAYILFIISKEDIETMLISENKLIYFSSSGILYLLLAPNKINSIELIINNLSSVLIIFFIMYSIKYISYKFIKINSLGMGDIKLSSLSSIWLGIKLSSISICISFILSAFYSLHGIITKRFKKFHQYPFAPFLSIGILFSWILDKIYSFQYL